MCSPGGWASGCGQHGLSSGSQSTGRKDMDLEHVVITELWRTTGKVV